MPSNEVIKALAVCAELCGANLSDGAARVIASEVGRFRETDVLTGLTEMRRTHEGRFSLAAVLRYVGEASRITDLKQPKCYLCGEPATERGACATHQGVEERARQARPLSYHMERLKIGKSAA